METNSHAFLDEYVCYSIKMNIENQIKFMNTRDILIVHICFRFLIIFFFQIEDKCRKSIYKKYMIFWHFLSHDTSLLNILLNKQNKDCSILDTFSFIIK